MQNFHPPPAPFEHILHTGTLSSAFEAGPAASNAEIVERANPRISQRVGVLYQLCLVAAPRRAVVDGMGVPSEEMPSARGVEQAVALSSLASILKDPPILSSSLFPRKVRSSSSSDARRASSHKRVPFCIRETLFSAYRELQRNSMSNSTSVQSLYRESLGVRVLLVSSFI